MYGPSLTSIDFRCGRETIYVCLGEQGLQTRRRKRRLPSADPQARGLPFPHQVPATRTHSCKKQVPLCNAEYPVGCLKHQLHHAACTAGPASAPHPARTRDAARTHLQRDTLSIYYDQ